MSQMPIIHGLPHEPPYVVNLQGAVPPTVAQHAKRITGVLMKECQTDAERSQLRYTVVLNLAQNYYQNQAFVMAVQRVAWLTDWLCHQYKMDIYKAIEDAAAKFIRYECFKFVQQNNLWARFDQNQIQYLNQIGQEYQGLQQQLDYFVKCGGSGGVSQQMQPQMQTMTNSIPMQLPTPSIAPFPSNQQMAQPQTVSGPTSHVPAELLDLKPISFNEAATVNTIDIAPPTPVVGADKAVVTSPPPTHGEKKLQLHGTWKKHGLKKLPPVYMGGLQQAYYVYQEGKWNSIITEETYPVDYAKHRVAYLLKSQSNFMTGDIDPMAGVRAMESVTKMDILRSELRALCEKTDISGEVSIKAVVAIPFLIHGDRLSAMMNYVMETSAKLIEGLRKEEAEGKESDGSPVLDTEEDLYDPVGIFTPEHLDLYSSTIRASLIHSLDYVLPAYSSDESPEWTEARKAFYELGKSTTYQDIHKAMTKLATLIESSTWCRLEALITSEVNTYLSMILGGVGHVGSFMDGALGADEHIRANNPDMYPIWLGGVKHLTESLFKYNASKIVGVIAGTGDTYLHYKENVTYLPINASDLAFFATGDVAIVDQQITPRLYEVIERAQHLLQRETFRFLIMTRDGQMLQHVYSPYYEAYVVRQFKD